MSSLTLAILMTTLAADAQEGVTGKDYDSFETSQLRCVIGNNAAMGAHRERYNGVFNALAPGLGESPFVEAYAGLNLEHYFDARPRPADNDILFEPRIAPMTFRRIDATTAELHQPATPFYGVESWTRFKMKAPHCIDMAFRCVPRKDDFEGGFFGVFWASYINAPLDKSIYFLRAGSTLDAPQWEQLSTQAHGEQSSLWQENDHTQTPFAPGDLLYANPSRHRYSEPFYYGRFRDHVLIFIFRLGPIVRFAQSPSGGGRTAKGDATNPAWDFQLIVPDYQVGKEYSLDMRFVLKPWAGRDDVLAEVRRYLKGSDSE